MTAKQEMRLYEDSTHAGVGWIGCHGKCLGEIGTGGGDKTRHDPPRRRIRSECGGGEYLQLGCSGWIARPATYHHKGGGLRRHRPGSRDGLEPTVAGQGHDVGMTAQWLGQPDEESACLGSGEDRLGHVPLCVPRREQEERRCHHLPTARRSEHRHRLPDARPDDLEKAECHRDAGQQLAHGIRHATGLGSPDGVGRAVAHDEDATTRRKRRRADGIAAGTKQNRVRHGAPGERGRFAPAGRVAGPGAEAWGSGGRKVPFLYKG